MRKKKNVVLAAIAVPLVVAVLLAYRYVRDYDYSLPGPLQGIVPIEQRMDLSPQQAHSREAPPRAR